MMMMTTPDGGFRRKGRRALPLLALLLSGGLLAPLAACDRPAANKPAVESAADPQVRGEVVAALERFNTLMQQRDATIMEEFSAAPDVTVVGSESDEVARGRAQVMALFRRVFGLPVTLEWQWRDITVSAAGQVAWIYADGELLVHAGDEEQQLPYRLTGVLLHEGNRWRWVQMHGSQPEAGPDTTAKPTGPAASPAK